MPEHICALVAQRKHERWAAFRQLQATSNILHLLSNGRIRTIDDLRLPRDILAMPVERNERRVVRCCAERDEAFIVSIGSTHEARRVLPDDVHCVQLLVLGLDQCAIGAAGISYAQDEMRAMMLASWDKIHRLIRDMKLSVIHASGGVFLKSQLYSNHLWSVNYKPFSSGIFGDQKQRLLNVFLSAVTFGVYCVHVIKYCHLTLRTLLRILAITKLLFGLFRRARNRRKGVVERSGEATSHQAVT